MPSEYEAAVAHRDALMQQLEKGTESHVNWLAMIERDIEHAKRRISAIETGLAASDYDIGRSFMMVKWWGSVTPEVISAFGDAVEDLRHGANWLRTGYYGVKAYDQWASQRFNAEYGSGPTHGAVWFSIGLRDPKRAMTEEERITCVNYLNWLRQHPRLIPLSEA